MSSEEEQVRRLLASVRTEEPLPPEVAGRLDDVLAGLVAERSVPLTEPPAVLPADVTPLAGRGRRRVASWAVAAAAVVVGGVAVGQLVTTGQQDASESAAGAADTASDPPTESGALGGDQADGRGGDGDGGRVGSLAEPDRPEGTQRQQPASLPRLRTATLEADLLALRGTVPDPGVRGTLAALGCLPTPARVGDALYAVELDGAAAAVVLRPATAGGQPAVVRPCDGTPAERVLLPAPAS